MLFNADRNLKDDILNQMKKEANDYREKKFLEKQRRINEERKYLENFNVIGEDERAKRLFDQKRKIREVDIYNQNHSRNVGQRKPNENVNSLNRTLDSYDNFMAKKDSQNDYRRNNDQRTFSLNKLHNHFNRNEETTGISDVEFKQIKLDHQRQYKQDLDSQMSKLDHYQSNKLLPKSKEVATNPFSRDFGNSSSKSDLSVNPILNPTNNLNYNKYLFPSLNMHGQEYSKTSYKPNNYYSNEIINQGQSINQKQSNHQSQFSNQYSNYNNYNSNPGSNNIQGKYMNTHASNLSKAGNYIMG